MYVPSPGTVNVVSFVNGVVGSKSILAGLIVPSISVSPVDAKMFTLVS